LSGIILHIWNYILIYQRRFALLWQWGKNDVLISEGLLSFWSSWSLSSLSTRRRQGRWNFRLLRRHYWHPARLRICLVNAKPELKRSALMHSCAARVRTRKGARKNASNLRAYNFAET